MIAIVTPEEMAAIDAEAPEAVEVLIARAGAAVARVALDLLGGAYGRRVVVVAGKGNNGADGRDAARRLARRGVRVAVVDAEAAAGAPLPPADLVIDAAYGTGLRGAYLAPDPGGAPVLAVDIPSGVSGRTGQAAHGAVRAEVTIAFAALKPGLVLGDGPDHAGDVRLADIGLDCSRARAHLVTAADVAAWLPPRPRTTHKWRHAAWVVGGSPGMAGAPALAAAGAQRAGASYVRLSIPGAPLTEAPTGPPEAVRTELPAAGWAGIVEAEAHRFGALAVGPGLGLSPAAHGEVAALVDAIVAGGLRVPATVLDGDALTCLAALAPDRRSRLGEHVVLTPHDGEFERLAGHAPGPDRFEAARGLAAAHGAVVLLKGSTTVVAHPSGRVLVNTTGDARLATAGTGDVLTGILAALAAQGVPPFEAAAAAAWLHGRAGTLGFRRGLVAGDLPALVPRVLDALDGGGAVDGRGDD